MRILRSKQPARMSAGSSSDERFAAAMRRPPFGVANLCDGQQVLQ